jgi:ADP-dependent phosphofructokinase/glucokinase
MEVECLYDLSLFCQKRLHYPEVDIRYVRKPSRDEPRIGHRNEEEIHYIFIIAENRLFFQAVHSLR